MKEENKEDGNGTPGYVKSDSSLLNFGEYRHWAYRDILRGEPHYVAYICMGSNDIGEEQRQFQDWVALKNYGIQAEASAEKTYGK